MKRYNCILFDLDGTLIDTTDLIVRCFEHSLSLYRVQKTRHEISSLIGLPLMEQFKIYFQGKNLTQQDYKNAAIQHMEYQLSIWQQEIKLFPTVKETLQLLCEKKIPLGIVTSRRKKTMKLFTEHLEIYSFFKTIVTPEDTEKHKPNPEPVLLAMKNLSTLPEKTLFVGDAVFDLVSGRDAGVDSYFVSWEQEQLHQKISIFEKEYNIKAQYNESNFEKLGEMI